MLREFGLPQRCVADPDLMIPIDSVRQLLEVSAQRSGVEAFGLLMAEARRLSNLGPLGLLVREQPTLRGVVDACLKYGRRLNEALFLAIEEAADVVIVREEFIVGRSGSVRQSTELALGVTFRILQAFLGPAWRPRRVCFAHKAPADRSVHRRVFGRNVEFVCDFNGIVCAGSDLERPNPNADPQLARLARKLLEADSAAHARDLTAQVREVVVSLLGTGTCTVERVAQHLGVHRRTIHRQLLNEGQTFSAIVEAVRRELAPRYLMERHRAVADVSGLLGFSSPSSFSQWYRRQFGTTPSSRRTGGRRKVK
ncbi:MAG TPA: AraC family transcriptional regulator [Burkholderiaceae bacterium]|nr:AraC family transcriptional regulator [Burkholderiaceae bacterium]